MRIFGVAVGSVLSLACVLIASALASASGGPIGASHASPSGPTYTTTFNETGLAPGTSWSVHVAFIGCGCEGVHKTFSSTSSSVTVALPNGSYQYHVLRVPGYFVNVSAHGTFNVTGVPPAPLTLAFHTYFPFAAAFHETGLPNGTVWTVTVAGNGHGQEAALEHGTASSYTASLNFSLPNGTYRYTVAPVNGSFLNGTGRGRFVIAGASPAPIAIGFVTPPLYNVTFTESGLFTGTNWSARIGGMGADVPIHESHSSTGVTVRFALPAGSYHYAAGEVLGYELTGASSGEFNVTNASVAMPITYLVLAAGSFYAVTFNESGLANGTHWALKVVATHTFGHSRSATDSSIGTSMTFYLQNGTYRFLTHNVRGYTVPGQLGTFVVNGSAVGPIPVTYRSIATFGVTFNETGLPNGTSWELVVRSQAPGSTPWHIHLEVSSTNSSVTVSLPNGAYCYRVVAIPGYHVTTGKARGSLAVDNGSPPTLSFGFSPRA